MDSLHLSENLLLIGSWAEYVYEHSTLLQDYKSMMKTRDLDILVCNIRKFPSDINLPEKLKEMDYLVERDYINFATKFITPKQELSIDFLVGIRGSGKFNYYKVGKGIVSEGLRHTNILSKHKVMVMHEGIKFYVPVPEAYAIHKMVINHDRSPSKKRKDCDAVLHILPKLNVEKMNEISSALTKIERKYARDFCENNGIGITNDKDILIFTDTI